MRINFRKFTFVWRVSGKIEVIFFVMSTKKPFGLGNKKITFGNVPIVVNENKKDLIMLNNNSSFFMTALFIADGILKGKSKVM